MSVLAALAERHTALTDREVEHLHRLLGEWQMLADLSFADLLLFAPVRDRDALVILAQVRPYPAQTLYQEDMVGRLVEAGDRFEVITALKERRIVREGEPRWRGGIPIRAEAVPVTFEGRPIAAIGAEHNLATARTPSQLEASYTRTAGDLMLMIAAGVFPFPVEEEAEREVQPRVGDGFVRLGEGWAIEYASPNAISAYRRLGVTVNIVGERVGRLGIDEKGVVEALDRGEPADDEVEASGAWVLRRFLPLIKEGTVVGGIAIVRDVTELRRRDRMLLVKDATIREIHHRVKNNLQTVAALLRLQARRLASGDARRALEESVRRITAIALVHETLSGEAHERVAFDQVVLRIVQMAKDGLVEPERTVLFSVEGSAGDLPSEVATPLALVLAELIQNAVEHAFVSRGGSVTVSLARDGSKLTVVVADDGVGLPEGFTLEHGANLGLQIVGTLVTTEMGGEIRVVGNGGTRAELSIPLRRD